MWSRAARAYFCFEFLFGRAGQHSKDKWALTGNLRSPRAPVLGALCFTRSLAIPHVGQDIAGRLVLGCECRSGVRMFNRWGGKKGGGRGGGGGIYTWKTIVSPCVSTRSTKSEYLRSSHGISAEAIELRSEITITIRGKGNGLPYFSTYESRSSQNILSVLLFFFLFFLFFFLLFLCLNLPVVMKYWKYGLLLQETIWEC